MFKKYIYNVVSYFVNLILPLLYGSYIYKTLGPEINGKIAYINVIIFYVSFFATFSLQSLAIRELSKIRSNYILFQEEASKIFSIIFYNSIFSFLIYIIICFFSSTIENFILYFIVGIIIVANGLTTEYIYISNEKFKSIAIRSLALKIIYFITFFTLIKNKNDYLIYLLILVVSVFTTNIFFILKLDFKIKLTYSLDILSKYWEKVKNYHLMNIGMMLYNKTPTFLLVNFATFSNIGIFSFAEKFLITAIGFSNLLVGTFQPRMIFNKETDLNNYNINFKKYFIINTLILGFITLVFFLSSEIITIYLGGEQYLKALNLLKFGSILIFISGISNFITTLNLLVNNKEKLLLKLSIKSFFLSLPIILFFVTKLGPLGAILAWIFSELIMCLFVIHNLHKNSRYLVSMKSILFTLIFLLAIYYLIDHYSFPYSLQSNLVIIFFISILYFVYVYILSVSLKLNLK